ncbi:MAG: hypothetical protein IKH26_01240 [Bacteroidaceae bacterium]|nr:hypothetical protein [Bacteroidaceae bacterium]
MSRLPYPLAVLLLMLLLAVVFHLVAMNMSQGGQFPIVAPYVVAVLTALYAWLNLYFYKSSQQSDNKRLMNVVLILKIARMFFFLLVFLVYCLAVGEKIIGFALELICMFFAYLVYDTIFLVRMQNEKKKVKHE